jgi:hypothetical protein
LEQIETFIDNLGYFVQGIGMSQREYTSGYTIAELRNFIKVILDNDFLPNPIRDLLKQENRLNFKNSRLLEFFKSLNMEVVKNNVMRVNNKTFRGTTVKGLGLYLREGYIYETISYSDSIVNDDDDDDIPF